MSFMNKQRERKVLSSIPADYDLLNRSVWRASALVIVGSDPDPDPTGSEPGPGPKILILPGPGPGPGLKKIY